MVNASSTSTACHAGTGKTFPDLSSALSIRGDDIRLIINVPIFIRRNFPVQWMAGIVPAIAMYQFLENCTGKFFRVFRN